MPVENEQIARAQQIRNGLDQLKASLDYDEKKKEIGEIEEQMTAPGFWDDQEKAQVVVSRIKALKALVKPMDEIIKELDELDVFFELGQEDEETAAEIPAKLAEVEKTLQNLQTAALLNGPFDANDAILTINARDGGTDANDWAEMLLRMYMLWAQANGYTCEILDRQDNEEAGINSASVMIRGPMAYGYLKGEIGTHRLVRISPFNSEGKRQTSFAAVDVNPDIDDSISVDIKPEDVREDVFGGSARQQDVERDSFDAYSDEYGRSVSERTQSAQEPRDGVENATRPASSTRGRKARTTNV